MIVDFSKLSSKDAYFMMTQTVIPRPIAWVLTDNGVGEGKEKYNLAPFSFFNAVSAYPPLLMFAVGNKVSDGQPKDTLKNIQERGKATIHIPSAKDMEYVTDSAVELPHGQSEVLRKDYALIDDEFDGLPRLAQCDIAFHCDLHHTHHIENATTTLVFMEIKHIYLSEGVSYLDDKDRLRVDARKVDALGRLGGIDYVTSGEIISSPRPKE